MENCSSHPRSGPKMPYFSYTGPFCTNFCSLFMLQNLFQKSRKGSLCNLSKGKQPLLARVCLFRRSVFKGLLKHLQIIPNFSLDMMSRFIFISLVLFMVVSLDRSQGISSCRRNDPRPFCRCNMNSCWGNYESCIVGASTEAYFKRCIQARLKCSCACSGKHDTKKIFGDLCGK